MSRPVPTFGLFQPWPGVLPGGCPPPPPEDRLPHGAGTVWAVVSQYPDGRPAEVVVAFPTETAAETYAVTSGDVGRYTVVPVRFSRFRLP